MKNKYGMRKIMLLSVMLLSCVFAAAQEVNVSTQETNILKELEKPDPQYNSRVTVNNNANINVFPLQDTKTVAYRVRLFFDNQQDSRDMAYAIKGKFHESYPHVPVEVSYKTPNFMVTAGYFLSHVEATAFLTEILGGFPKSFIIPVEVPLTTFNEKRPVHDSVSTSQELDFPEINEVEYIIPVTE